MSKLVKQSQLREIVSALWDKVKEKTEGAFKEASYSQADQTVTFTKENGQVVTVGLNDLVSKSNENIITGKTLLTDGHIRGGVHATLANPNANTHSTSGNFSYFTTTSLRVEAGTKISSITLAVDNNIQVGATVTGVNLGAITADGKQVLPYLIQNGTAIAKENTQQDIIPGTRVIEIPVNKAWEQNVLLVVGAKGMMWGQRPSGVSYTSKADNGDALPAVGSTLQMTTGNWCGSCIAFSEETSLHDLPTKTSNNTWTGKNFIMDGYVMGGIIAKLDNKNTTLHIANGVNQHYMGYKAAQVISNQTLSHITIGIHSTVAVGTRIDGIKVGAIKVSNDELTRYVIENASAIVQENTNPELTNCTRSVVVSLDTPFTPDEDYWFCISCDKMTWGDRSTDVNTEACTASEAMPEIGQTIGTKRNGYLGKYLLHADKISLNNLANVARSFVRSVNTQLPNDQGELTLGIEHIENLQEGLDSKLNADEVLGANEVDNIANKIPRLDENGKLPASIIPQLAITSVHTVANKTAAEQLITDGTCRAADIVIITDENNAIYICKSVAGSTFDDKFIELSLADGTVKSVNSQVPNAQGSVTLTASDFSDIYSRQESDAKYHAYTYDQIGNANDFKESKIARTKASTTNLPTGANSSWGVIQFFKENENCGLQMWHSTDGHTKGQVWTRIVANNVWSPWKRIAITDDLQGTVKTVNGQVPNESGQVALTGSVNQNANGNITISVGNVSDFATLQCMTSQEVQEIKNLFV